MCTNDVRLRFSPGNEAVLDRMAERLKKRPEILDRRREVVEHPFGSIKQWMYQGAFLMRGLGYCARRVRLTALAYNLRRALNILGVEAMTAAGRLKAVRLIRVHAGVPDALRSHQTLTKKAVEILSRPLSGHSMLNSWSFRRSARFIWHNSTYEKLLVRLLDAESKYKFISSG